MTEGFTIPWSVLDPEGDIRAAFMERELERTGSARQALWSCPDGWVVGYTTERVKGGPASIRGKFAAMAYKPVGKGARSGNASEHVRVYMRGFAKRKTARARAERMYEQHEK